MEQKRSRYTLAAKIGMGIQFGFAFGVLLTLCLIQVVNDHSFRMLSIEWIKCLSVLGAIVMLPPSFGIMAANFVFHSLKMSKNCYLILAAVILCIWSYTCFGFVRLFWREYSLAFVLINTLLGGILANFVAGTVARKKDIEIVSRDGDGSHAFSGGVVRED